MNDGNRTRVDSSVILNSQVAQGLAIIGDRWAFMIIRECYLGIRRFKDLQVRTGAARGTLASRLKSLVDHGVLYRNPYQDRPVRHEYRLTDKGLDLYPVVLMMWRWEHDWGDHHYLPAVLTHTRCGHELVPESRCGTCQREIRPEDVRFSVGRRFRAARKIPPRFQRRASSGRTGGLHNVQALECVGDRWTSLVLAAAFFGLQRFDDIASSLGIATNILADRLKTLTRTGVFDRVPYQERPRRYEYHMSKKGRDFYKPTLAIHEWANKWLIEPGREPLLLRHKPCDSALRSDVVCRSCGEIPDPHDVSYEALSATGSG